MRKAKVLQHISILEVPVCCFLASLPRSETSLGFLSTSERCRVAPESSTLTAILNKETSALVVHVGTRGIGPRENFEELQLTEAILGKTK